MNYAYVDASWQEDDQSGQAPEDRDWEGQNRGGWGLVLLRPGDLAHWLQGQLSAPDNNAAELCAVLEAVRVAPAHEALTVYTDNQTVIALIARGRGPQFLTALTREVHDLAEERGIALQAKYTPRTGRHMLTAHTLANEARRGERPRPLPLSHTEVLLEHRSALGEARISLRRREGDGQVGRLTAQFRTNPDSAVPPSVQVLLAALELARPGESLVVRRAGRVAQGLWHKPERALRAEVNAVLTAARQRADDAGVQVIFMGTDEGMK